MAVWCFLVVVMCLLGFSLWSFTTSLCDIFTSSVFFPRAMEGASSLVFPVDSLREVFTLEVIFWQAITRTVTCKVNF